MKASCGLSASVLVTIIAALAFCSSDGHAADQASAGSAGPTERRVHLEKVRTLDCQGAFVCRQETLLFITGAGKGYCLDLSGDPTAPVVLSDSLPHAWDIAVKGNHAFVADNSRAISVYDISDRKTWRKVGECKLPAAGENIIVRDDLAYVAGCQAGLQILNIRDPSQPVRIAENRLPKQDIDAIALDGNVAYLYDHAAGTLRLVDVMDPAHSRHLSLFEFGRPFIQGEMDLCRGYAYCVAGQHGVVVVDVRDSKAPRLAAVIDTPGFASDVVVSGDFAFIADGAAGVQVMDVRDPSKPVEAGCFTSGSLNAQQVAVLGDLLYVANKPPLGAVILRFQPPR